MTKWTTMAVVGLALVGAERLDAQMSEFLGPHVVETLPYEIPGTGRIGGITMDGYLYLYVANQDDGVWRISPTGEVDKLVEGLFGSASGTVMADGDLMHSSFSSSEVWRIERDGRKQLVAEGLDGPVGMTRVGDDVYAINYDSDWITKIGPDGAVTEFVRDPRLREGNGLTSDAEGNLYAVSLGHTTVLKVTPDGTVTEVATLPGTANAHVAFAGGALYVTQIWENAVVRVELNGNWTVVAGDGSLRARPGPTGESRTPYPNGITATRSGRYIYFNTLEGNMLAGHPGVIRVHRLHMPTPERAFRTAFRDGGLDGLRRKFDAAMSLREAPPQQILAGVYQSAWSFLREGDTEAGLTLMDWCAAVDEDELRRTTNLGEAHFKYGDARIADDALTRAAELAGPDSRIGRIASAAKAYRGNGS